MAEIPSRNPTSSSLRVLGVDPAAVGPTGFAVIERDGRKCRILHYGAFKVLPKRQKASVGAALHDVHSRLCALIRQFQPDVLAVESVFTAINVRTALRLAEVRGVVLLAAEQLGLQVRSYSPREVKARVAGYGQADKKQVQVMVRAQLGMKELPEPPDAADALAVALCHLQADQFERRYGLPAHAGLPARAGIQKANLPGKGGTRNRRPSRQGMQPTASRGLRIQSDR